MTLNKHLDDIRNGLSRKQYENEASVIQGIVLRSLHALGWPIHNTQIIIPEYSVEGRRVDLALCHPPSEPLVFIEVKAVGQIAGAEKQLFEYAFHRKVPIAILTDGQEWRFFYPSKQGDYTERRVYTLDLSETENEEGAARLSRYLNYKSICSGKAVRAIKYDYRNISKERQIKKGLLEAWIKLVEEADECLIDVVASKTESLCRYKPTREQVLDFLKNREGENSLPEEVSSSLSPRRMNKESRGHLVVTMPTGEKNCS